MTVREHARELVAAIEAEATARERSSGEPSLGREHLFRQDPHFAPNRLKKGPATLVHAASRAARDSLREAYRIFVSTFRRAADRFKAGFFDVPFPEGSFPPAPPFQPLPPTG